MRNTRYQLTLVAVAITLAALLQGCTPPSTGTNTGTSGTLQLLVTDKPYPVDLITSAEVSLTQIQVHDADAADSQNDGDTGWTTIYDGDKTFDLIDLQNGRTDLLADANLPAGDYDQMRLIVTGGRVVLTNDSEFDLTVPSGEQTGIKLHFDFTIADGDATVLLLDVDLSKAFKPVPAGKIADPAEIREFKFQPSLGMRLINLLEAGSIAGTVTDAADAPLESVLVTAYDDSDTEITSTTTDPDGTYVLSGLPTGTYTVEFSATGYVDAQVEGVSVTAGEQSANVNASLAAE